MAPPARTLVFLWPFDARQHKSEAGAGRVRRAVSGGQSHKGTSGDDVELREVGLKGHDSLLVVRRGR